MLTLLNGADSNALPLEALGPHLMQRHDHCSRAARVYYKLTNHFVSDKRFAKRQVKRWLGGGDIEKPVTFNEKIQFLKLHDRNPQYKSMADKYEARKFVARRIGPSYLNTLYARYCNPEELDFDALPQELVLKATHASGMTMIIRDSSKINKADMRRECLKWLKTDYAKLGREWVYEGLTPSIIAEALLLDDQGEIPVDYKVFCFHGQPKVIQVDLQRFTGHKRAFFTADWESLPFSVLYSRYEQEIQPPPHLEEMLGVSRELAAGVPFLRVDLYDIQRVIFGEMTFYPGNGCERFDPHHYDLWMGSLLNINAQY